MDSRGEARQICLLRVVKNTICWGDNVIRLSKTYILRFNEALLGFETYLNWFVVQCLAKNSHLKWVANLLCVFVLYYSLKLQSCSKDFATNISIWKLCTCSIIQYSMHWRLVLFYTWTYHKTNRLPANLIWFNCSDYKYYYRCSL